MAERKVVARIVSRLGPCPSGHQIGQEWDLADGPAAGMCQWAYNSIYPFYCVLRYGGRFPWQHGEGPSESIEVSCPDPDNAQRIRLEVTGTR